MSLFPAYASNPLGFCREVLRFEPNAVQALALTALVPAKTLAMATLALGRGEGKTHLAAAAALWAAATGDELVAFASPDVHMLRDASALVMRLKGRTMHPRNLRYVAGPHLQVLRGARVGFLVVDNADGMGDEEFELLNAACAPRALFTMTKDGMVVTSVITEGDAKGGPS